MCTVKQYMVKWSTRCMGTILNPVQFFKTTLLCKLLSLYEVVWKPSLVKLRCLFLYQASQECPLRCSLRNREAWCDLRQASTLALLKTHTAQQLTWCQSQGVRCRPDILITTWSDSPSEMSQRCQAFLGSYSSLFPGRRQRRVLPYMAYTGMCHSTGYCLYDVRNLIRLSRV